MLEESEVQRDGIIANLQEFLGNEENPNRRMEDLVVRGDKRVKLVMYELGKF